jgi:hypothetical protein
LPIRVLRLRKRRQCEQEQRSEFTLPDHSFFPP